MDTLSQLLCLPSFLTLVGWQLQEEKRQIIATIASTQKSVLCPVCQTPSAKIHSHYERTLTDISLAEYKVTWKLWIRKFFCHDPNCARQIFSERLQETAEPWARKTSRFCQNLRFIGLSLGGEAGKRLSQQLGLPISGTTLLKLIHRLPLPALIPPKVLGVDDWAFRKGQNYGTILVDLEKRKPIALLPDREARTLSQWLIEHPGVKIITRDRSKTYRRGAKEGAPEALQVADRFHLLKNLSEALEKICGQHSLDLKIVERALSLEATSFMSEMPATITLAPASSDKTAQDKIHNNREQRLHKFEQVWQLKRQGLSHQVIAQRVGISQRTVQRFLQSPVFPERQGRSDRGYTLLKPYRLYILERWNGGCFQARQLYTELVTLGYRASYMTVARYVRRLREGEELSPRQSRRGRSPQPLTPRRVAYLLLRRPEHQNEDDLQLIKLLKAENPELAMAITLTQGFTQIVRERLPQQLDNWIQQASDSSLSFLVSFAHGLVEDYDAVKAGITLDWSNGQVRVKLTD
ncbi:hypothetical protein C7H19_15505 [Aphanothece hegewaldii CCALA 016]|uniref:HTH IS21-type domain-containing protein n=1 Tax=Aphanothece hegewaldii CCALA 016 TaxID=2107694 RepID=A0A2T1LVS7_9CHRO|nr:ISL3 family transposase [Aphanothece hegewaldii]PSF35827.1 hypothetical protein C7H19_15505 [Aphanothece hegewaldii CCALA 016]